VNVDLILVLIVNKKVCTMLMMDHAVVNVLTNAQLLDALHVLKILLLSTMVLAVVHV
jgi:hypothetical protein